MVGKSDRYDCQNTPLREVGQRRRPGFLYRVKRPQRSGFNHCSATAAAAAAELARRATIAQEGQRQAHPFGAGLIPKTAQRTLGRGFGPRDLQRLITLPAAFRSKPN